MTSTAGDEELHDANRYQDSENVNTQDDQDNIVIFKLITTHPSILII